MERLLILRRKLESCRYALEPIAGRLYTTGLGAQNARLRIASQYKPDPSHTTHLHNPHTQSSSSSSHEVIDSHMELDSLYLACCSPVIIQPVRSGHWKISHTSPFNSAKSELPSLLECAWITHESRLGSDQRVRKNTIQRSTSGIPR